MLAKEEVRIGAHPVAPAGRFSRLNATRCARFAACPRLAWLLELFNLRFEIPERFMPGADPEIDPWHDAEWEYVPRVSRADSCLKFSKRVA